LETAFKVNLGPATGCLRREQRVDNNFICMPAEKEELVDEVEEEEEGSEDGD